MTTGEFDPVELVVHGPYLVNPETGEIVDVAEPFTITDEASLDWVLNLFADVDAELVATEARYASVLERLQSSRARLQRRREWLLARFGAEIEAYAAATRDKRRTEQLVTPHGTIRHQRVGGGITIQDVATAITWIRSNRPDVEFAVVRTHETIDKTEMRRQLSPDEMPPGIIDIVPERRELRIVTTKETT